MATAASARPSSWRGQRRAQPNALPKTRWFRPDAARVVAGRRVDRDAQIVLAARDLAPGVLATFDVFDENGRYVQEIVARGDFDPEADGLFLDGDYLMVVTDLVSARDALRGVFWLLPLAGMTAGASEEIVGLILGSRYLEAAPLLALLIFVFSCAWR